MTVIKEQIILSALDQFSQYGIKSVSMDDIARNMSISKRTLYGFFDDKETLLVEALKYINARLIKVLAELEKGSYTAIDIILLFYQEVMKRPRWYNGRFYDDLKKFPRALAFKESEKAVFTDKCYELFERGVKEGVFQEGVNFEIMALLAREQVKMKHPPKSFAKHSNTEVYNTVLFTFLRGISTEKGRAITDRWYHKMQLSNIK